MAQDINSLKDELARKFQLSSERQAVRDDSKNKNAADVIRGMRDKWPSTFVARSKMAEFSGGLYASGTAANADSAGNGIQGAFRVGRQIAYPVSAVIDYLISKLED